jgi:hypothetical protein
MIRVIREGRLWDLIFSMVLVFCIVVPWWCGVVWLSIWFCSLLV